MAFSNRCFAYEFHFAALSLRYKFIATAYEHANRRTMGTPDDAILLLEINDPVQIGFPGQCKGISAYTSRIVAGVGISGDSPLRPSLKFEQVVFGDSCFGC